MSPSSKLAPARSAPQAAHPLPAAGWAGPPAPRGTRGTLHCFGLLWGMLCVLPAAHGGALRAWRANRTAALAAHGPAAHWNTSGETDLSLLFRQARNFNEDLNRYGVAFFERVS